MDIVERLRGIYRIPITDGLGAVGSGEEPNNPTEYVSKFETSPIQHEAAKEIERLRETIQRMSNFRYDNYENPIENFNNLQAIARQALEGKK